MRSWIRLPYLLLIPALLCSPLGKAESRYRSGFEVCTQSHPTIQREHGFWVPSGETKIYAWTKEPFSFSKKTVVFVNGGPGDEAHENRLTLPGWNVVFFDQRGIACSRPDSEALFRSRDFYSSEKTVADIEALRRYLNLKTVSLYGVSYGTVPTHLYAHHYPQFVRAVVVEGVVGQSDAKTLIENPYRRRSLQAFFGELPIKTQDRILELSARSDLSPAWFSQVGRMMFYLDGGKNAFRHFLDSVLWQPSGPETLFPGFADHVPEDTMDIGFGGLAMRMLSCQEMGMNTPGVNFDAIFVNRRLVRMQDSFLQERYCAPLGFQKNEPSKVFRASEYPLEVPVVYVQGRQDGITPYQQARASFHQAAHGPAQFILVKEGGHQPLQGPLSSGFEPGARTESRQQLLGAALSAECISEELLTRLNQVTQLGWTKASKNLRSACH